MAREIKPRRENRMTSMVRSGPAGAVELAAQLRQAVTGMSAWMAEYGEFEPHPALDVETGAFERACAELRDRLRDNYPFWHPRYAGQMLKPPHPAAIVGYLTAML